MEFRPEMSFKAKRLVNHVIQITDVMDQRFCRSLCFMEPNCASYNVKTSAGEGGDHKCELNNSTHEGHEDELEENLDYFYRGAKVTAPINQ